jgi:hypothetical protein
MKGEKNDRKVVNPHDKVFREVYRNFLGTLTQ